MNLFRGIFFAGVAILVVHVFREIGNLSTFTDLANTATAFMAAAGVGAYLFKD